MQANDDRVGEGRSGHGIQAGRSGAARAPGPDRAGHPRAVRALPHEPQPRGRAAAEGRPSRAAIRRASRRRRESRSRPARRLDVVRALEPRAQGALPACADRPRQRRRARTRSSVGSACGARGRVTRTVSAHEAQPLERTARPAGEHDRHAASEDDSGRLRVAKVVELLGEHSAGFQVRDDEDVGLPGHRGGDALARAAAGETASSNASGPSTRPPRIWPRSAILPSAAASSEERSAG